LDANGDGVLTKEEIREGLKELNNKDIDQMFEAMDIDGDGFIEYSEFITATLKKNLYLKEERLIDCFELLDKDGDGKITVDELRELMESQNGENHDKAFYELMISEYDKNGDGVIDFEEFVEMMKMEEGTTLSSLTDL